MCFGDFYKSQMVKISRAELFKIANKYSKHHPSKPTAAQIKSMKHAQLKSLIGDLKKHPVHGRGIIQSIKNAANKAIDKIKSVLFFPPNKLPGNSQKVFNQYAGKQVTKIYILRKPIQGILSTIANWITAGKYQEKVEELGYTDAFHLYSVFEFADGQYLQIEKNARITITPSKAPPANVEQVIISVPNVTLDQLFETTRKAVGDHEFFQYSADKNNCQKFLNDILRANGLATAAATKFIMQDAKAIFGTLSSTQQALAQAATDLGGKIEQVTQGQGKHTKKKFKPR